jgi:hypothetical protein
MKSILVTSGMKKATRVAAATTAGVYMRAKRVIELSMRAFFCAACFEVSMSLATEDSLYVLVVLI